jgi:predicted lipoprotein with Yx(FWY)xxD motif
MINVANFGGWAMRKLKKSLQGFAPVETILVLVIVGLVAFVIWYIFNTKSNTDSTYGNSATTSQYVPPKKAASTNTKTTNQIVTTKTSSSLGQYLAGGNGKTLYTYGKDTSGVSNCTGSCLTDWPVYTATSATNLPTNVTVITRSDSTKQYAYKGLPLYYFTGDTSPGMVTGDGVNDFHAAKP